MGDPFAVPASLGHRRLYLDLDGVVADFDAHYLDLFGADKAHELTSDAVWPRIDTVRDTFFATMPLCPGAAEFFSAIWHLQPIVLTACPKSDYRNVAVQKREWVRRNLCETLTVLPVMGGANKPLFMHWAGDILIDDLERNCVAWRAEGGLAIQHRNFHTTASVLWQLAHLLPHIPNTGDMPCGCP